MRKLTSAPPSVLLASLTLALLVVAPSDPARADATPRVQVVDFTVDGEAPPAMYRQVLVDGIAPTIVDIERCYDARLASNPALSGDFRLRLWVSARQVIRTTPETSVGDSTLEECTRAAVRTFTLPPEAPEGGATVRFVVRFTPPPAAPAAPATQPPATSLTAPHPSSSGALAGAITQPITLPTSEHVRVEIQRRSGKLDASAITEAFPASLFEACAGDFSGTLPVTVNITARGKVSATAARGTTGRPAAATCVARAARAVTAPTARAASSARLVLTFTAR